MVEEVIVTAQKRQERLQDVPVPVTAVSGVDLIAANQTRIQDYYATVPGFNISPAPGAGGEQMLSLRGISSGYNTNPTVGITIDDVQFGSSSYLQGNTVPDIDPADLARVEVLRGPQGTLYGASSMGGLIKFVTVDPSTDTFSGRVQAGASSVHNGSAPGYSVRGSVNLPVGDTFAVRASAFSREDPGYINNPVLHADGVNKDVVDGGRVSALWKPADEVSVKLSALLQDMKANGSSDVDYSSLPGYTGPPLGDLQQNYLPGIGGFERKVQAYSATVKARPLGIDLIALSGYNISSERDTFDYSYQFGGLAQGAFGVGGVPLFTGGTTWKFTQEIRLSSNIGNLVDWLVGGYYTHEHSTFAQGAGAENPATGAQLGYLIFLGPNPSSFKEYAAFTDWTFHINHRFDVQIGGRESRITQAAGPEPESGKFEPAGAMLPLGVSRSNAFTYLLTPRFKLSPDIMLYARLASGYRAGGPNQNPDPAVPTQYSPDRTEDYELGTKGELENGRVSFDLSAYYINWKDLQINLLDNTDGLTYTTNGSRAKSQGLELSLNTRPVAGLKLGTWLVWNEAIITRAFPAGSTAAGAAGDRLPYSSRVSGNLSADEDFPLWGSVTGYVGATVSYIGKRLGTFVLTGPRQSYPGYTKADLRAGARYDTWTFDLFLTNVADKRGLLGGGLGAFPPYGFTIVQPRTVGLSVSKSF